MTALPPPGQHGGRAHLYGEVLELSASLNPVAPDPTPIFRSHLESIGRYPDPERATAALADMLGVDVDRVLVTNGGAEAIALVAAELKTGWVEPPEFGLYERHLQLDPKAGRWLSDPNNPTGRLQDAPAAAVRDEAFYPLATGRWTRGDSKAIVVGSLTKTFACPGVRIGYVLAPDPELIDRLRYRQPGWALSGLACESVPDLLVTADLARWSQDIAELRHEMTQALADRGWFAEPADANYVLLPDAPGLRELLFQQRILVRSTASFGIPEGVRIAVPSPQDMNAFISAIPHRD